MPFSDFRLMAVSLLVIALCALELAGFYRWCRYQYLDAKAYLFDRPEDDETVIYDDPAFAPTPPRPAGAQKKRTRGKKS